MYLRNFEDTDFAAVHEYGSIPDFSQYEEWGPNTESDSHKFIVHSIEKSQNLPRYQYEMAIILKTSGELVGGAHIEREAETSSVAHIGYAVNPRFQNNGYATETSIALIKFGFSELNQKVIYATCDTRNIASYKVLEKLGMKLVGTIIGNRKIRGGIYDSYRFEMTSQEFEDMGK